MVRRFNKKEMQPIRRKLRNCATPCEEILWTYLRNKQICGTRFLRQFSVNWYVLDFYAPHLKLAIELDGSIHFSSNEYIENDRKRQQDIESTGIKFLRFRNEMVMYHIEDVLREITKTVGTLSNSPLVCDQGRGQNTP